LSNKENRPKQSFLKGALVLSLAALIVKLIGAVFKIPLANILGGDGMGYYTTAYDMALLGAYSVKNVKFREICSTKNYKAQFLQPETVRYFSNHNRLLSSCEGVIGIKTGFTKKSGRCLVSACERNGKLLVAVTLNAPDDWNDHKKLYDYGYSLYEETSLCVDIPETIKVYGSDIKEIMPRVATDVNVYVLKSSQIKTEIQLNHFLYAPVRNNDIIGKILVLQNGCVIAEQPITSAENADASKNFKIYKPSIFKRFTDFFKLNKRKVD